MNKQKIFINIFSNWTNLLLVTLLAFFVSPILVHSLGNENYGLWTLIGSITGYFTVLDLGVNTALVRFISKYESQKKSELARKIYSNAFIFFAFASIGIVSFTAIFAFFFQDLFSIQSLSSSYIYFVFLLVGLDFGLNMFFCVFTGTLWALHEFFKLNIISITLTVIKNLVLVVMLLNGYNLMTIAIIQLVTSITKNFAQYILIKTHYPHFKFRKSDADKNVFQEIFSYSIYSFIIAVAFKMLFFTDAIVVGSLISVAAVTIYTIPMTLMTYLEQLVYAAMSVLTPVISSNEAIGDDVKNKDIYILGTRYSLMISLPVLFVLFTNGDSFISIWMGSEYGLQGASVLKILVVGYIFYLSQVIANSILKGVGKHKVFAYILAGEALFNLGISIILVRYYGIIGVALGTTIPLVIVNLILVPVYTCRVLRLNFFYYMIKSYKNLFIITLAASVFYYAAPVRVTTYLQLGAYSIIVATFFIIFSIMFVVETGHKDWAWKGIRNKMMKKK